MKNINRSIKIYSVQSSSPIISRREISKIAILTSTSWQTISVMGIESRTLKWHTKPSSRIVQRLIDPIAATSVYEPISDLGDFDDSSKSEETDLLVYKCKVHLQLSWITMCTFYVITNGSYPEIVGAAISWIQFALMELDQFEKTEFV